MAFEKFSRSAARTDTGARWISIQANGAISVSYSALKEIGLPDEVFLLHDPEGDRIAVQAADPGSRDAYKMRLQGSGDNPHGARVVSANAFFRHIGLDAGRAKNRYEARIEGDMVIADIPSHAFDGS